MTKKSRYLLLVLGFFVFIILAPLIVLYVRGVSFDFAKGAFVTNGLLAIRVQPASADIFLNGALKRQSSGDIRFVLPGDYGVSVKKTGYYTWNKRLTINAGQVTWASPPSGYIYLLRSNPQAQTVAVNVIDFYSNNGKLLVLKADSVTAGPVKTFSRQTAYPLPKAVNAIVAQNGSANNFVLADASGNAANPAILFFNSDSGTFSDLGSLFPGLPKFQFGDNGDLYALSAGTLYRVDAAGKTKTALFSGVQVFYSLNNSLYFVQANPAGSASLLTSQSPFSDSQVLLSNLPNFVNGKLLVTYEKQIFLLADQTLYYANSSMQKIIDNVSSWDFNSRSSVLAIKSGAEIYYYDIPGSRLNFVSRSSEPFVEPIIKNSIGWALSIKNNKLTATELDNRDSQNQYTLYSGNNLQKFYVDDAAQKVLLLDGGELKSLVIR